MTERALPVSGVRVRVRELTGADQLIVLHPRTTRPETLLALLRAVATDVPGGEIGWDRYVGADGTTITMSTFGASAPLAKLQDKFGFTLDNVCKVARELLGREA